MVWLDLKNINEVIIMKICVLGSGTMGQGIVSFLATMPFVKNIFLWTRNEADIIARADSVKKRIIKQGERAGIDEDKSLEYFSKIKVVSKFDDLVTAEFYIEAVAEDANIKKDLFYKIGNQLPDDAIVATNTSSLSVTELSMCIKNPERFIGIHFFNPVVAMTLVELIVGLNTSSQTLEKVKDIIKKTGKEPVVVNDSPGFVVNRMLIPMINEAVGIYAEGVASVEDIDKAMMLGANHPIGPLALADLIGTDVCLSIMETLHAETGDSKYRAHPLLRKTVRAGFLGRKVKRGFYEYD